MADIMPPEARRKKRGVGRQFEVYPLEKFPKDKQAEIAWQVAQPRPPAKWLDLGLAMIPSRAWYEWHWQRGVDPEKGRPAIPRQLRQAVYERDGYACLHCGATERLPLDHIYPYSKGGRDTLENLQTLCKPCNSRKGARVDAS